jgi:hypothetical protein
MYGWPTLLTQPMDFRAKLCGTQKLTHRPYLYYLTPSIDLNVAMCVSECPPTTGSPIKIYEDDGTTETSFTYTRLQCDRIGKYCFPVEPTPRKLIETHLTAPVTYIKTLAGELFIVGLNNTDNGCDGSLFIDRKWYMLCSLVWAAQEVFNQTCRVGVYYTYCHHA